MLSGGGAVEEDAGGAVHALQPHRRRSDGLFDEREPDPLVRRVDGLVAERRRRHAQVHLAVARVEVGQVVEHHQEVAVLVRHRRRHVHHLLPVAHQMHRRTCNHKTTPINTEKAN